MQMLIVVTCWVLFGFLTSYLAKGRGRDPVGWFLMGMGLQVVALIILYILPSLNQKEAVLELNEDQYLTDFEFKDPIKEFQSKEWFYVNADRIQQGPYSFEELQKVWDEGKMSRESYVWSEGMDNWKRVDNYSNFENVVSQLSLVRI